MSSTIHRINNTSLPERLDALVKDTDMKIFLILDNLSVLHAKPVKACLPKRTDKIEVYELPSDSPELNPEQHNNTDLKQAIVKKIPVWIKAKLSDAPKQHVCTLESYPKRVQRLFKIHWVKYAV